MSIHDKIRQARRLLRGSAIPAPRPSECPRCACGPRAPEDDLCTKCRAELEARFGDDLAVHLSTSPGEAVSIARGIALRDGQHVLADVLHHVLLLHLTGELGKMAPHFAAATSHLRLPEAEERVN